MLRSAAETVVNLFNILILNTVCEILGDKVARGVKALIMDMTKLNRIELNC